MIEYYQDYTPTNKTLYEYMTENSAEYVDLPAISYFGRPFTYRRFYEMIDEMAKALHAFGIGKDDIVASSMPGTPEGIVLIYAINKLGARYCAFDCRSKEKEIRETMELFHPKLCLIPDFQVKDFKNIRDCAIVHVSPVHSISPMMKLYSGTANICTGRCFVYPQNKNFIRYDRFLRLGKKVQSVPTCKSTDNVFGYFYTSGTTYGRKSIILTNENIIAAAIQFQDSLPPIVPGDRILNVMPLFTCYSVTIATHLPLSVGVTVHLIPLLDPKKLKEVLLQHKPNYIITVPAHWEYFINENFDGCDLSFLKTAIVGGDVMDPAYEAKINDIFMQCGSGAFIAKGYGLSETTSTGTCSHQRYLEGSIGFPLKHTKVAIFDPQTCQPLGPMEKGEICLYGPTLCKGYFKEEEMTKNLLRLHDDGKVWLHSGDVGYMNEDGFLFFCERLKRMYVRFDGTKISPHSIEQIISTCPLVKRVMVIGVKDEAHTHGMCARAIIVLHDGTDKEKALDQLKKFYEKELDQHMVPEQTVFVDRLPYTKNGKLDYFAATQL